MEAQDTLTIAPIPWRAFFTDPQLQALIDTALVRNTDLRTAYLRVEQAEASLHAARMTWLPSLALTPEGSIARFDKQTTRTYSLGASASWEVDIFGRIRHSKEAARAALEQTEAYRQAVQTSLIATVATSYYTLLMLDEQLRVGHQTLDTWTETIRTFAALKRAGQANDAAVLQAEANRFALENAILTIRKSIHDTETSLCSLLAKPPHPIPRTTFDVPYSAFNVPCSTLSNRPDVRAAEASLRQALHQTNVARSAFYPSLTLSGTAGWTNNAGGIELNPAKLLLNAVGSLTQPIFARGQNTANLRIAKAEQEAASLAFQQTLLNAGQEVNDALTALQTARDKLRLDEQQIEKLRETVRKTSLLMHHSTVSYLEVLTAQQSLLAAEQQQSQDKLDEISALVTLYHALGGGTE